MLEPLRDPAIVLNKMVTTKNVHERVQGSSDAHVYQEQQRVETTRLTVHGLYGMTIALELLEMMGQLSNRSCGLYMANGMAKLAMTIHPPSFVYKATQ